MPTIHQLNEMERELGKDEHWAYNEDPEQAFNRITDILVNKLGYIPSKAERLVTDSIPVIQECLEDEMPLGSIAEFLHRR